MPFTTGHPAYERAMNAQSPGNARINPTQPVNESLQLPDFDFRSFLHLQGEMHSGEPPAPAALDSVTVDAIPHSFSRHL